MMIVCLSRTGLAEITAANFTLFTMGPAEDRHASIFILFNKKRTTEGGFYSEIVGSIFNLEL